MNIFLGRKDNGIDSTTFIGQGATRQTFRLSKNKRSHLYLYYMIELFIVDNSKTELLV